MIIMEPVATTWDAIVAALNGLGTWQLVAVIAAIGAAAFALTRVLDLIAILVRGHAPADTCELDELTEALGRIEDALGERGHLAGCLGDVYGELDEQTSHARVHGDNVEQLLADNLAAVRSVRVAVLALDDEEDEGELDTRAQAQLYAYVPGSFTTEPKTDADRSTRLHELAIDLAAADADARGIDLTKRKPLDAELDDRTQLDLWRHRADLFGVALAGSDDGIRGDAGPMLTTWTNQGHEHRPYVESRSHRHGPDQPEHRHDADGWSDLPGADDEGDR